MRLPQAMGATVHALGANSTQFGLAIVLRALLIWGLAAGWNRWRNPVPAVLRTMGGQVQKR